MSVHKELRPLHEAFAKFCPGTCIEKYAEGGHVEIKDVHGIEDGIYITPLCVDCNNQFDKDIELQPLSVMVEEVDSIIEK